MFGSEISTDPDPDKEGGMKITLPEIKIHKIYIEDFNS